MTHHYQKYLKLTRGNHGSRPIIVYQVDEKENPILDPRKIVIIRVRGKATLAFDSENDLKFVRYELLEKSSGRYSDLKMIVDKKISELENKVDSEKVD